MNTSDSADARLQSFGMSILRYALATNLVWIGALKFEDYEVENINPLVTSSPLFARLTQSLGKKGAARLIGATEMTIGLLVATKRRAPRASTIGSLGAVAMFASTLSFLATTPGIWQENHGAPKLSMVGQFLLKDSVFLGASLLTAADSARCATRHAAKGR